MTPSPNHIIGDTSETYIVGRYGCVNSKHDSREIINATTIQVTTLLS